MLKIIDGLRTADGANSKIDMPVRTITGPATGQVHDMTGFQEFLAIFVNKSTPFGSTAVYSVQESNEAAANFVNVAGTTVGVTGNTVNTVELVSVDWRNPSRKQYAKTACTVAGANTTMAAIGLRLTQHHGDLATDVNVVEVAK